MLLVTELMINHPSRGKFSLRKNEHARTDKKVRWALVGSRHGPGCRIMDKASLADEELYTMPWFGRVRAGLLAAIDIDSQLIAGNHIRQ